MSKTQNAEYVIVRDDKAGVYCGELQRPTPGGAPVRLTNARHIYTWQGRLSTVDIAARGVGEGSEVTAPVPWIDLYDPCATIRCTRAAESNLRAASSWTN